jgi:hypothetical protein
VSKSLTGRLYGKAHELDVVLVPPGTNGFPRPADILIGVEAKHRPFNRGLLKELLGVRREMTMRVSGSHNYSAPHWFIWWSNDLPVFPPSGLVAFASSAHILRYNDPADFWGIHMQHLPY